MPKTHCNIEEQIVSRSGLVWVSLIGDDNGTVAASDYCPLNFCSNAKTNVKFNETDIQCKYKHSGILCRGCQSGLSLALGTAQCLQCFNKYLALFRPFALAGPVLVGFSKFLDLFPKEH